MTIYDRIDAGDRLWIPVEELERLLSTALVGLSLAGLPPKTRAKRVKQHVCEALGYPVPPSFRKTQPRFPGQTFDVYVQKSNNLQIWNEELVPARRYVIIRVGTGDVVTAVKVVPGSILMTIDKTGTHTRKYQARMTVGDDSELATEDTDVVQRLVRRINVPFHAKPLDDPQRGQLLPIAEIFDRLRIILGESFDYIGSDQDRNRGGALHALACQYLGYDDFQDDGRFPDLRHQLLEFKLQTSSTIDLGLTLPNSMEPLDMPSIDGIAIRMCDVRYAIFFAHIQGDSVVLKHLVMTTGERFFDRFPQFLGNVMNAKIQIRLPIDFFG